MVRDGVANIVIRLEECGFDPRKVGPDSWESRCPAHKARIRALHHAQPARSCPARVPERGELPAFSESSAHLVSRTIMCTRKRPIG